MRTNARGVSLSIVVLHTGALESPSTGVVMPSVAENRQRWTEHAWARGGHEWSPGGTPAGGEMFWWRGLMPRLRACLPARCVLEIGPGFGRWTTHLANEAERLILVDVTERCIDHCRRRFATHPGVEFWVNDGQSLAMVDDDSVDFVFSFDSLVHAEAAVLAGYLQHLARKLRPGGTGFIHHSNLGALLDGAGAVPSWVARRNWRSEGVSARIVRQLCREAGLVCLSQEIVNWISRSRRADRHGIPGSGLPLTDAFTTFMRCDDSERRPTKVYVNAEFAEEWRQCATLAEVYPSERRSEGHESAARPTGVRQADATWRICLRRVAGSRHLALAAVENAVSRAREHRIASQVRRYEPIANALRRKRCPECRKQLSSGDLCRDCAVVYWFRSPA